MRVHDFKYNGVFLTEEEVYAPYTAEFKEWTRDPGIAICDCSDGIERLIPIFDTLGLPPQPKTGIVFGISCSSRDGERTDIRLLAFTTVI